MQIDKHMTNKEEAQWLINWWKNYGQGILIAVIIGLGLGFGWRYWTEQNQQKDFEASNLYQQIQNAQQANGASIDAAKDGLQKSYPNSIFTQLSILDDTKKAVSLGHDAQAITLLQTVVAKPKIPALASLARLQIAQLYLAQNQPTKALDVLNAISDSSFEGLIDNNKAQAYALLNQPEMAKVYLNKAIDAFNALHIDTSLLKLNAGFK
jgi:predicted negative regulator of RcsB-dependent stress response